MTRIFTGFFYYVKVFKRKFYLNWLLLRPDLENCVNLALKYKKIYINLVLKNLSFDYEQNWKRTSLAVRNR